MVVVITDAITDLVLAVVPAYLCRHIQMKFMFKVEVLVIFALRFPLLVLSSLFFKYWRTSLNSDNIGVARTTALILQQSQLCVSLIAGTIPCLRSFMNSFDTGSGVKARLELSADFSGYGHHSSIHHSSSAPIKHGESYQMSSLNDGRNGKPKAEVQVDNDETARGTWRRFARRLRSDKETYNLEMDRHSTQESDHRSQMSTQELVIRKEVEVRWETK